MKIKEINEKTNYSSFSIKNENDIVNLRYEFHGNDPDDDCFYSLSFKRIDYEMGINNLIEFKTCMIIGNEGELQIKMKDNNLFRIAIKTSRTEILEDVDYEFYN